MISLWLVAGSVFGGCFSAIAHSMPHAGRKILGGSLVAAAGIYVAFALYSKAPLEWIGVELVGVLICGIIALVGIMGSRRWLAAGWAFHPLWDIGLHFHGCGARWAPAGYAVACASFDIIVALDILRRM